MLRSITRLWMLGIHRTTCLSLQSLHSVQLSDYLEAWSPVLQCTKCFAGLLNVSCNLFPCPLICIVKSLILLFVYSGWRISKVVNMTDTAASSMESSGWKNYNLGEEVTNEEVWWKQRFVNQSSKICPLLIIPSQMEVCIVWEGGLYCLVPTSLNLFKWILECLSCLVFKLHSLHALHASNHYLVSLS